MPNLNRTTLTGVAIALGLILLGALGLLSNPKPQPVPPESATITHAAAKKAGATVAPTVNQ
ncbi:MAG: hypothetical protein KGK01_06645 [Bradyrhizobium sp.]|uniref:hypothetical protein n=1 Tax=Bradyrhizobium sp. TaxID=376 RepID=UPI001C2986DF|nr:hypothetical protein [Bradyrhizobium sp.]MBU6464611.1 hypothetical protein [Pseudomonadota bacterium]MDE2069153.1 hypothetical protein [Bradyrhizobium sp.]MDE2242118.1 hypothetical protein [Bradyrhizobium sp.]MDE2468932.1 hypothetical protein [Bradyrhizobium sp.]